MDGPFEQRNAAVYDLLQISRIQENIKELLLPCVVTVKNLTDILVDPKEIRLFFDHYEAAFLPVVGKLCALADNDNHHIFL